MLAWLEAGCIGQADELVSADNVLSFTYVMLLVAVLVGLLIMCFPLIARCYENYLVRLSFAALAEQMMGSVFGSGCLGMLHRRRCWRRRRVAGRWRLPPRVPHSGSRRR